MIDIRLRWEAPYGTRAKYWTNGDYIVEWESVADGAVPPDWMEDGFMEPSEWRALGYRKDGRWQVRRMTSPGYSEALEIAPTLRAAKEAAECYMDKDNKEND